MSEIPQQSEQNGVDEKAIHVERTPMPWAVKVFTLRGRDGSQLIDIYSDGCVTGDLSSDVGLVFNAFSPRMDQAIAVINKFVPKGTIPDDVFKAAFEGFLPPEISDEQLRAELGSEFDSTGKDIHERVLAFRLRSKEGKEINIYSDGTTDGSGTEEYCMSVNLFSPRFDTMRGIIARVLDGQKITKEKVDFIFKNY